MTTEPRITWRIWTGAPESYDYPYCTRTGREHDTLKGAYEVLATTCRVNAAGQMMRYQSGLYHAALEDEPVVPRSWKAEVYVDEQWVANGLRFKTQEDAERYGADLLMRWMGPSDYRAWPCFNMEPNYDMERSS